MAVASSSNVEIEAMDASPSEQNSDPTSSAPASCSGDSPDGGDPSLLSSASRREAEIQNAASLRSEEYRQLFRLPPEEVLLEDFNCACQENILVQGHMYLFLHYICFYSNIFGFETKKIIHFRDVTSVKRAKTAGIFHNAIEIFAGGKKYFFASFLSRDEAFKLINDGWLQHGNNGTDEITEKQESASDCSFQENGFEADKSNSFQGLDDSDTSDRLKEAPALNNTVPATDVEDNKVPSTATELRGNAGVGTNPASISEISSSAKTWTWTPVDSDAPKIPECYSKVAESKFPIRVEEFFDLFFSDAAAGFIESFHERCGDKGFQCSSWYPHDQLGHARDVSFQHPIKIYFGAKFGSCREVQKFLVYRNSHLVIETFQEINDVPFGDHFRVEALWDVRRDVTRSRECCILRLYIYVAFSKKTIFKGKIVQSTLEECREAYVIWIDMAHELLKARNLERQEDRDRDASMVQRVYSQGEASTKNDEETISVLSSNVKISEATGSRSINQDNSSVFEGVWISCTSISTILKEAIMKIHSFVTSQVRLSPLAAITFLVILLMQLTIVMLLVRPQNIHVIPSMDHINSMGDGAAERLEAVTWLEKRLYYLKDEMYMVEVWLERMRSEHARLKEQLRVLEQTKKQRR